MKTMTEVEEIDIGDTLTIDGLGGQWRVTDEGEEDLGLFVLPYAAIVQNGDSLLLVGNWGDEYDEQVKVRDGDDERHMSPDGIEVV